MQVRLRSLSYAISFLFLVAGGLVTSSPAQADPSKLAPEIGYDHGDVHNARSAANAGALRANGTGLDGLWGNPAAIVATPVYHVGAVAALWPEAKRQSYGAGAMDSVTSRLGAGLGFVWSLQDPQGIERESRDLRLALAFPVSSRIGVGLTTRYLYVAQRGLGPLGPSYASESFSFDVGARAALSDVVSIGLLGTNLSNPGNGFQPTTVGGGIGVAARAFSVEVDALADFTTWEKTTSRAMVGGEYLAAGSLPLRLGYGYESEIDIHAISAGVGYIDPSFSVELAGRRSLSGPGTTAIMLTLQYFVESSGVTRTPSANF